MKNACKILGEEREITPADLDFICDDARLDRGRALELLTENGVGLSLGRKEG